MQISQVNENELGLLITGLRAIHVADQSAAQHKLLVQLETELATRFGKMIGTAEQQARPRTIETNS